MEYTYTSGEFASLFGINKKTLEYYRSIGLFQPSKIDENGYSRYSYHQIDTFYTIQALKKLNVSLEEIKTYIECRCPESLIKLLEEKQKVAEMQLYEMQKTVNYLKETISHTKGGIGRSEELNIIHKDKEYLLVAERCAKEVNRKYQKEFEEATFSANTSCIGTIIHMESNEKQIFIKLYKDTHLANYIKEEGLYATMIHKGPNETSYLTYDKMMKEIHKQGYECVGTVYEEYLINDLASIDKDQYVSLITMPIYKES